MLVLQATANNSQHAALLLHCLSSLGAETFASVLLPKLVKQRSARSVALTCRQLRDLCHGSVQRLNLTKVLKHDSIDTRALENLLPSLPQHFSNCTSAQLWLRQGRSYYRLSYLLPGLARCAGGCVGR
jgi:hypothetical protein